MSISPPRDKRAINSAYRRGAGRYAVKIDLLEHWHRATLERGGKSSAASVGDLGLKLSRSSFVSPPVAGASAPVGGSGGVTRAARPSSPSGFCMRSRCSRTGSRRKAGAKATSPASLSPAWFSSRLTRRP